MKKICVCFAVFTAMVSLVSCGGDGSGTLGGKLGGKCYENKSCNEGLICDEESNTCIGVLLDKFVPIKDTNNCEIKVGVDTYCTEGQIDLAFTFDYILGFQMTNYIRSSDVYAKEAEIEYEWDPKPQSDGRKLTLDKELWRKKTRKLAYGGIVVITGIQTADFVHIFEEAQAKDLLDHVDDINWIESPLIIKMRIIGELADGTEVKTNKMNFNIVPTFGKTIQTGSVYLVPEGGFQDTTDDNGKKVSAEQQEYDTIMAQCSFQDPLLNGCFSGQDSSQVNCYAGDSDWEKYVTETYGGTYIKGYGAASVVETIFNTYKKGTSDNGHFTCCPYEAPEAPEEW